MIFKSDKLDYLGGPRKEFFYSMCEYFFLLLFHSTTKISMTASMKKITWFVIYLIKVNYTSHNYTSYKSTWTSPMSDLVGANQTKVRTKQTNKLKLGLLINSQLLF